MACRPIAKPRRAGAAEDAEGCCRARRRHSRDPWCYSSPPARRACASPTSTPARAVRCSSCLRASQIPTTSAARWRDSRPRWRHVFARLTTVHSTVPSPSLSREAALTLHVADAKSQWSYMAVPYDAARRLGSRLRPIPRGQGIWSRARTPEDQRPSAR